MSLIVMNEPKVKSVKYTGELEVGTWFVDHYGQVYAVALDDRNNEKRVFCCGDFCKPFIPNIHMRHVEVGKVLKPGTLLQITSTTPLLEGR